MIDGSWVSCVVNVSSSNTLSEEADLGRTYQSMMAVLPTLTATAVAVKVAMNSGGTYYSLYTTNIDGSPETVSTDENVTTGFAWDVPIGGFQYVKLLCSNAQAANRTFYLKGVRS